MTILILIPLWKRPEIVKAVFKNLWRFKKEVSWTVEVLAIISPEDPSARHLEALCNDFNVEKCWFKNDPLGRKLNAGINYALKKFDFDYLMNFGSDDLIHPKIEQLYELYIKNEIKLFGIDSLYFTDLKKTFYFKCYTDNFAVGAARMIHKSIFEKLKVKGTGLYSDHINRGCDGDSSVRIKTFFNISDVVIKAGEFPYLVDIKTNTNINHFISIESHQSQIKYFPNTYLKQFYAVL